ncbi:hypothetical protein DFJ58DRAFT_844148 [Suillus subalutaceus]|uniref:uncharacterized protein n=1 Tax=Suillus subalutaceus TaxID=48586 RepID=UPI001B886053|nr:uncharacterized protein DFJ58DRAFT_844148 [Suillus subalutaceus]KAG1844077.1 hypothetical protein DFJ58DRAFT_844148 [Suillus subalutaceus]
MLFWLKIYLHWFRRWPERAILFPGIPTKTILKKEQQTTEIHAKDSHKVQLQTWFCWWTNASKKNRSLKKDMSIFEAALVLKSHTKSTEEIYMDMVYNEWIKPLIKAKQEAGNISTAGQRMALGQKFCKELLEDKSDQVKDEVREKYDKQKKVKRVILDNEDDNDETDADAIAKKTQFIVSFMCAGPEPRHDWDIVSLSCHPSETPAGSNFSQLCPDKDNTFLAAYQQYAELIFSVNKCNPLLPGVEDDNELEELEGCDNGEEDGGCDGSMDWNIPGLYIVLCPPDSKHKRKSKLPAAEVNCNPAIEPTPTITPMNMAKPKAKPKAKPLTKSGAVMETLHATADEGNMLGHLTASQLDYEQHDSCKEKANEGMSPCLHVMITNLLLVP